jgi:hypothetical protein
MTFLVFLGLVFESQGGRFAKKLVREWRNRGRDTVIRIESVFRAYHIECYWHSSCSTEQRPRHSLQAFYVNMYADQRPHEIAF